MAMSTAPTMVDPAAGEDENTLDSELVPSSLAPIIPILRVANEIQKENRRVAYLCRFHALEMAHRMDPTSSGRGVRQFKTHLLHTLEREEEETKPVLAKTDPREIKKFYQNFYEKNIRDGQQTKKPEEMFKIYQIASVLYDVLITVVPPSKVDEQTLRYAKDVEEKREYYEDDNILPTVGVKPVEFFEVDPAAGEDDNTLDSELAPSSLASIAPILRVANEIEKENRRVAYLCRFHAFEKTRRMDPTASGHGVRQFKTYLIQRLEKEEEETKPVLTKTDPREIQKFYQNFYEKNIRDGKQTKKSEEMFKIYQIASVLYDVLRLIVPPSKVDEQTLRYAKYVDEKREYYEDNNILHTVGVKPVIMELSEVDPAAGEDGNTLDNELIPSSLASIAPILRVANEIEKENRRVAYLCRFHAYEMAHRMDPTSSGRGVRKFKTYLLHRLEREEEETKPVIAKTDPREIQKFYQNFYEKNIRDGQQTRKPEEMSKIYQIASVLYDVLRTVVPPSKVDEQTQRYAKDVEEKREYYEHNNILHTVGVKPVIMELSEVDPTTSEDENTLDSELVPSSLASIAPILHVANEIEIENRRVAYLCRFHAYEMAHRMDPTSSRRGVRQFKTYLLQRLEREEEETKPMLAKTDPREIQRFYQNFYEKNIRDGQQTKEPEEMAKIYQIASVLYDALRTVVLPSKVDEQTQRYAKDVEEKTEYYEHNKILPTLGVKPLIMELSEIDPTAGEDENTPDSELVPSSLASIAPILRVAHETEKENRRVAYLCRFHAYEMAHRMDPTSSRRGVRQFKTYLLQRLEREEEETKPVLAKTDPREIQKFYQNFYEKNIRDIQQTKKPEEMSKIYQIASVLYDVLRTVVPPTKVDEQTQRYAKDVEDKREYFEHNNILPTVGVKPVIMELSEDKGIGTLQCCNIRCNTFLDEEETKHVLAKTDPREIQKFYQNFDEKNIRDVQQTKKSEEMSKIYQIANVLHDALRTVVPPSKVDEQTQRYAKDVEEKREYYEHYNNLPLK